MNDYSVEIIYVYMKTIYDTLLQLPLFQGIERVKLIGLLEKTALEFKKYHKDDVIFHKGEECRRFLFLIKGNISVETIDKSNKFLIYERMKKSTLLFPAFLFGKQTQYPATAKALDEVSLLSIEKSQALELMQNEQIFLLNFLNIVSNKTQTAFDQITSLSETDLKKNFAFFILTLTEKGSSDIHIKSTQQDLADFFGVARPSLLKILNEFKENDIIAYRRKELSVLDVEKLSNILFN